MVNQLAKNVASIGTPRPTLLAQDLVPHPTNIIKSDRILRYISHPSTARYNSIQTSLRSHPWFHNLSLPASLVSAICRLCFGHTRFPVHLIHAGPPFPLRLRHSTSTTDSPGHFLFHRFYFHLRPLLIKKIAGPRPCRSFYSPQILPASNRLLIFRLTYQFPSSINTSL